MISIVGSECVTEEGYCWLNHSQKLVRPGRRGAADKGSWGWGLGLGKWYAVGVYHGPLLDDGLQFQVRSSWSVQCGESSLLYVDYDTTLSQLSLMIHDIAVCTEFHVRGSLLPVPHPAFRRFRTEPIRSRRSSFKFAVYT